MKNQSLITCITLGFATVALTGCQSLQAKPQLKPQPVPVVAVPTVNTNPATPTLPAVPATPTTPALPKSFSINGKIGITTPKQAGSAFYTWGQNGQAFAIDLAGALNAGQTQIRYNGQTATLTNDKGTLTADNPEALLFKATGWQAPISQLPYWIMGQPAPSDSNDQQDDKNRLTTAQNAEWTAEFAYANADTFPNRITMRHPDGYKVVLTINRLS